MCKLKSGRELSTNGDLQNLITGVILRQTEPFTFGDLTELLANYLKGSPFQNEDSQVKRLCYQTLSCLAMSESVKVNAQNKNYTLNMPYPSTKSIASK